jgi:glycosyltransferase involved in cell wall biosynthesis
LIWDIYPEHVIQLGLVNRRNVLVRGWHLLNRLALSRAAFVVTLGHAMADTLREELHGLHVPIHVIPNWADTERIEPIPKSRNEFARAHGEVEKLTVLYSGNIGGSHGLDALVDVATALRDDARISFVLIGDGLGRKALARTAEERRLKNLKFLNRVSWDMLPKSQAMGDIAVVSQAPGTEHLSVPSKTYTALAAGSAILALTRPESDLARLVREHNVGRVHEPSRTEDIVATLRALAAEPAHLARLRASARRTAESEYSARVIEARWKDLVTPFLGASS